MRTSVANRLHCCRGKLIRRLPPAAVATGRPGATLRVRAHDADSRMKLGTPARSNDVLGVAALSAENQSGCRMGEPRILSSTYDPSFRAGAGKVWRLLGMA